MTEGNRNPSRGASNPPRRPAPPLSGSATLPAPTGRAAGGAPTPPRKRRRSVGGIVALLLIGLVAVGAGIAYKMLYRIGGGGGVDRIPPAELVGLLDPAQDKAQFPGKNRINILLAGKDYNHTNKGIQYTKGSRSDSIIMLSLDMDTGSVATLSIPRDTHVVAPDGQSGKINGTFARGGAPLLRATVAQLLGVTPDYYIAIKDQMVKTAVDKLGGIDVESIDAMNYDDNWGGLHIHLPDGKQTLTGDQAIGFLRFREVNAGKPHSKEEGDPRRMARQQQFIRAMTAKGKSLGNLFQLDDVADTALGQLETDMSRKQILALVLYFRSLKPETIQSASLDGEGKKINGVYFFVPDERKKEAMVDWLLKGDETAADRLTVVAVENGTHVRGAAARVTEKLRASGFDAMNAGVAAAPKEATSATATPETPDAAPAMAEQPMTRITYTKASYAGRAQKIGQLLGINAAQITKDTRIDTTGSFRQTKQERADVTVILGQDIAATFATPQQSARL